MAQSVKCLLSKHGDLSVAPVTCINNKQHSGSFQAQEVKGFCGFLPS